MELDRIRKRLKEMGIDAWLFYDFHQRDPISYRILSIDTSRMTTRRWFYLLPAEGEPIRLVHAIEEGRLDSVTGKKVIYKGWKEMHARLKEILKGIRTVAMQYSPMNSIPYISMVDAGTVELIRSFGVEVVSSADLVSEFEARVDRRGYELHKEAGRIMHRILEASFDEVRKSLRNGEVLTEFELQQRMLKMYMDNGMECDGMPPIVAVNEHSSDPHFEPTMENSKRIKEGDILLIDLWARRAVEDGIYYDITWVGFCGKSIPKRVKEVFDIVRRGRDRGIEFIEERLSSGANVHGYEVDDAVRSVFIETNFARYFTHRTGHSIGREVHGTGTNIDNFETQDHRLLGPGSLFSIEPGIYLPEFGIRSEVDIYIHEDLTVEVTGPKQEELILLM